MKIKSIADIKKPLCHEYSCQGDPDFKFEDGYYCQKHFDQKGECQKHEYSGIWYFSWQLGGSIYLTKYCQTKSCREEIKVNFNLNSRKNQDILDELYILDKWGNNESL